MNGERAGQRRKELGLSGEKVAQALNTTRVTISRWETGTSEPDDKKKAMLAKVLNTTVAYLMGDVDNPENTTNRLLDNVKEETQKAASPFSMAYWGGVVDNTSSIAESGDKSAIAYVHYILSYALSLLPNSYPKQKFSFPNLGHHSINNSPVMVGEHNENNVNLGA